MAVEETFKVIRSVADTLGLSKFPIPVSILAALICGFICYCILTYSPQEQSSSPNTVNNHTTGANSPILSDNHGTISVTEQSIPDRNKDKAPPPK